jgi:hypothetical protein
MGSVVAGMWGDPASRDRGQSRSDPGRCGRANPYFRALIPTRRRNRGVK